MTTVTTQTSIPAGPWTVDDLDEFPAGTGRRYELIDGALLVSAEPSLQHQRVNAQVLRLLQDACQPDLEAFLPIDVRLSPSRQVAPDAVAPFAVRVELRRQPPDSTSSASTIV